MNRVILGALGALCLVSLGLFWIAGQAQVERAAPPPDAMASAAPPEPLPSAEVADQIGPAPPEARELTREQRRFARYDRDSDGRISRVEMLSTRTDAFRKLDKDGNNLLTFEEWAVATSDRFAKADEDRNGRLSPEEFATTRPKRPLQRCKC